jgi:hypothetical protein
MPRSHIGSIASCGIGYSGHNRTGYDAGWQIALVGARAFAAGLDGSMVLVGPLYCWKRHAISWLQNVLKGRIVVMVAVNGLEVVHLPLNSKLCRNYTMSNHDSIISMPT